MRLTKKHALKALASKEQAWLTSQLQKIATNPIAQKRIFSTPTPTHPSDLLKPEEAWEEVELSDQLEAYSLFLSRSSDALKSNFLAKWACSTLHKSFDQQHQSLRKALQKIGQDFEKRRKSRFSYVSNFDEPCNLPPEWRIALHLTIQTHEAAHDYLESIRLLKVSLDLYVCTSKPEIQGLIEREIASLQNIRLMRLSSERSFSELLDYDAVGFLADLEEVTYHNRNHRRFLIHHIMGSDAVIAHASEQFKSSQEAVQALVPPPYHATHSQPPKSEDLHIATISSHGNFWLNGQTLRDLSNIDPSLISQPNPHLYQKIHETILFFDSRVDVMRTPVNFDVTHFIDEQRRLDTILSRITNSTPKPENSTPPEKIAVVRCLMGNTEPLLPQHHYDPDVDYFFITDDTSSKAPSPYQTIHLKIADPSPRKRARYVKTHLLEFLPNHSILIWLDANLVFTGHPKHYAIQLKDSGADLSAAYHPWRNHFSEEMDECLRLGITSEEKTHAQRALYMQTAELQSLPLRETGFMVLDGKSSKLKTFFALWWQQIQEFELRDQFSFNYAEYHSGIRVHSPLPLGYNLRNHRHFALAKHSFDPSLSLKILDIFKSSAS